MTTPDSSSVNQTPSFSRDAPGYWIMVGGVLFGASPLIVSIVASWFGSDIGITLHWLTLATAPIGFVIGLVGFVMAVIGLFAKPPVLPGYELTALPKVSGSQRRLLVLLYIVAAAVIALVSVIHLQFGFASLPSVLSNALMLISLPVLMAVWAGRVKTGRNLLQMHRISRVFVFLAVLVIPVAQIVSPGDMGSGMPTAPQLNINGITTSAGYFTLLAVLFVAPFVRRLYVRGLQKSVS